MKNRIRYSDFIKNVEHYLKLVYSLKGELLVVDDKDDSLVLHRLDSQFQRDLRTNYPFVNTAHLK